MKIKWTDVAGGPDYETHWPGNKIKPEYIQKVFEKLMRGCPFQIGDKVEFLYDDVEKDDEN